MNLVFNKETKLIRGIKKTTLGIPKIRDYVYKTLKISKSIGFNAE